MDDPEPRLRRTRSRGLGGVRQPGRARLPPHPRRRRHPARRHGVDARPHAHRADPTGRAAGGRDPRGSRRGSWSPTPRSATCVASRASTTTASTTRSSSPRSARSRTSGTCCSRAGFPSLTERAAFIDELRPLREIPAAVKDVLPMVAALGGPEAPPLDMLRTVVSLVGVDLGFRSLARHQHRGAAGAGVANVRARPDAADRALPAEARARRRRSRSRARVRGELPLHDAGRGAEARARARRRAVPDLDDRPRLQRVDLHRAA